MYGTGDSVRKIRRTSVSVKEDLTLMTEDLNELRGHVMVVLRSLIRFYRNTNVLQLVLGAFILAYCYGLLFGMIVNGWSFTTSTFFYFYTTATIGYSYLGNGSTVTYGLLCLYIFVSVLAVSLFLGLFVAALNDISDVENKQAHLAEQQRKAARDATENAKDPETSIEARSRIEVQVARQAIFTSFIRFLVVSLIGVIALVFLDHGHDFTYVEAILFVLETVTTVGFGTNRIDTPVAKWFVIIFIIPGCGSWASFVAALSRYPIVIRKRNELRAHIKALRSNENKPGISAKAARYLLYSHLQFKSLANVTAIVKDTSPNNVSSDQLNSLKTKSLDPPSNAAIRMPGWWSRSQPKNLLEHSSDEVLPLVQPPTLAAAHQADVKRDSLTNSLNQQEFIIHWLLATNQVSLQDVLDARDFFHTLDVEHSGVLHLPTYFSDNTTGNTFNEEDLFDHDSHDRP